MKYKFGMVLVLGVLASCTEVPQGQNGNPVRERIYYDGINFGVDGSEWANDFECDDPRFQGPGMHPIENDIDMRMDATDCLIQYKAGNIRLKPGANKT